MNNYIIRNFIPEDVSSIYNVQVAYNKVFPETSVIPGEAYLSPEFDNGNMFCALNGQGLLEGYSSIYPIMAADSSDSAENILWVEIKYNPLTADHAALRERLFQHLMNRVSEIKKDAVKKKTKICFTFFPSEQESSEYVLSNGFIVNEGIYHMARNLAEPIEYYPNPDQIEVKEWKMNEDKEIEDYVRAYNVAFPEKPWNIEGVKHFMLSRLWAVGTTLSAFNKGQLIGSIMLYWDEEKNMNEEINRASTEQIFVLPEWRGKGLATYLISRGMDYLAGKGMDETHLELRANNENALNIYKKLGYKVTNSENIIECVI
ncbi:GNAT family N-acetyltransferase [Paenibacillus durus]|uniref:GNAT family N-acetyltransferase n=1 Tax=Paenibacillus durus TaxID=44251 RepID=UPI0006939820|nr:GNAT family N-acetyltransferase [Paenibacillus durus]